MIWTQQASTSASIPGVVMPILSSSMKSNNRRRIGLIAIVVLLALSYKIGRSIMIESSSFLAKEGISRSKTPTNSSIATSSSKTISSISSNRSKEEFIDGNDDGTISTGNWWDDYVDQLARPWDPYMYNPKNVNANTTDALPSSYSYDWCIPAQEKRDQVHGLVFVKNHKAASSTGAGLTKRIAIKVGKRVLPKNSNDDVGDNECLHYWKHGKEFRQRLAPALLWTNVRYPPKQVLSQFFHFKVSREGVNPTTKEMIKELSSLRNKQINYLSDVDKNQPQYTTSKDNQGTIEAAVDHIQTHIMNAYHFMALVERMDESLVVFKILFGLDDADMIVLSSKSSGGYDDGKYKNTCFKLQKAVTTPAVDDFISNNFTVQNYDYLLHAAVNKSLDLTIEALGGSAVIAEHVQQHQRMHQIAKYYCQEQAKFPCSTNGTLQNSLAKVDCYWNDAGCGYQCVDRVLKEYQEGRLHWPVPS